jgi:starch synthase
MKILLATSELHPFSKTGGLADMVGALAKFLAKAGHTVGVVTPLYGAAKVDRSLLQPLEWRLDLPVGHRVIHGSIKTLTTAEGVTIYFVDQPDYFGSRDGIYFDAAGDYRDNPERFIFLSKAAVNLARYLPPAVRPEILHAHDWQTALVPLLVHHGRTREVWLKSPRTFFTIHNLAYQGRYEGPRYGSTNLPWDYFHTEGAEFHGDFNMLKAGIAYADVVTTVSPSYAEEIKTAEQGCGLEGLLTRRAGSLVGILNGVDYEEWVTVGNPALPASYSSTDLSGKAVCKAALQREMGLPIRPEVPLFGTIGRLADQKGHDIMLPALEAMLEDDLQFVLLGSGSKKLEEGYRALMLRHPGKAACQIGFSQALSHRIEAGSDFFLMPSRFEPCGLNQMYSLRYGTLPIVRATGGLNDSVVDITEDPGRANGIKFTGYTPEAMTKALCKAVALYRETALFQHFRETAMTVDFSWERTCQDYVKLYRGKK